MGFYAHTETEIVCMNFTYGGDGTDHLITVKKQEIYKANGQPRMRAGKPVWQPYVAETEELLKQKIIKAWHMQRWNQYKELTISEM